jgi:hypothetical protein
LAVGHRAHCVERGLHVLGRGVLTQGKERSVDLLAARGADRVRLGTELPPSTRCRHLHIRTGPPQRPGPTLP